MRPPCEQQPALPRPRVPRLRSPRRPAGQPQRRPHLLPPLFESTILADHDGTWAGVLYADGKPSTKGRRRYRVGGAV